MKRILIAAATASALAGCVSITKQPMSAAAAKELKGQSVAQTTHPVPDFAAMTAGKAAFAMIGAAMMISEGNSLIAANKVADPADAIAAKLMQELERSHGVKVTDKKIAVNGTEVAAIADAAGPAARYVVDVQTVNWSFGYFPTDWTHYRVIYTAKARLIDTANKATVAEAFCKRIPESNANAPTYDELTANEAAVLKKELALASDECVNSLKADMLTL